MIIAKEHERLTLKEHVTVETHVSSGKYPIHWHSFFEIEIIVSGKGSYVVNDISYDIEKNNVFFLTPTDFHYIDAEGELTVINLSFDEDAPGERDMIKLMFNNVKRAYYFDADEYSRLISAVELLRYECDAGNENRNLLLQYVIRNILRKNPPTKEVSGADGARGVKRAIVYMELHFKERITLERLAAEAGYHPTYFSEIFKKTTGDTYIEALTKLRIGHARTMLAGGFSVSDACFLSGFGSLSGFASAFKKACNMSPREYKRQHSRANG